MKKIISSFAHVVNKIYFALITQIINCFYVFLFPQKLFYSTVFLKKRGASFTFLLPEHKVRHGLETLSTYWT